MINKTYLGFSFIGLLFAGCIVNRGEIKGVYINKCFLYGHPSEIITLNDDKSFVFDYPYMRNSNIIGTWKARHDTLVLSSEYLVRGGRKVSVTAEMEYAHFPNFLIRGKKLYELKSDGEKKTNCYLIKQKKK